MGRGIRFGDNFVYDMVSSHKYTSEEKLAVDRHCSGSPRLIWWSLDSDDLAAAVSSADFRTFASPPVDLVILRSFGIDDSEALDGSLTKFTDKSYFVTYTLGAGSFRWLVEDSTVICKKNSACHPPSQPIAC